MPAKVDISGQRFGKWLALPNARRRASYWLCRCDCGTKRPVLVGGLRYGNTRSCGCSGHGGPRTLGPAYPKEYIVWTGMKSRCYNPNSYGYPRYGGRGIIVCARWKHSFDRFIRDLGPRPPGYELHRKDNDGDYTPRNACWVPKQEQYSNKISNVVVSWRGERMTLTELARLLGISYQALHRKYRKRKDRPSIEKAVRMCEMEVELRTMR
jgi:hypothetical protein